jgi:hypothetical protein
MDVFCPNPICGEKMSLLGLGHYACIECGEIVDTLRSNQTGNNITDMIDNDDIYKI